MRARPYHDEERKNIQQEIAECKEQLAELEFQAEQIDKRYFGRAREYIKAQNKGGFIPTGWGQLYDSLRKLTIMAFGCSHQSQMTEENMERANTFMMRMIDLYISLRLSLLRNDATEQED